MKKVKDVYNKNIVTIGKDTLLGDIIFIMKNQGFGKLPVVDGDKVIGVVTREDILIKQGKTPLPPVIAFWEVMIAIPNSKGYKESLKKFISFKVEDIMQKDFYAADLNDDLENVVTNMLNKGYNYVIVMENEKLVGIVTKSDLINKCY